MRRPDLFRRRRKPEPPDHDEVAPKLPEPSLEFELDDKADDGPSLRFEQQVLNAVWRLSAINLAIAFCRSFTRGYDE